MWKRFFEWRPKAWLFFVYLSWESSFERKHSNDVIFGCCRGEASVTSRIIYRCSTAHEAQSTTIFFSFTLSLSAGNGIWLVKLLLIKLKKIGALKHRISWACRPSLSLFKRKGLFTEIEKWAIKTTMLWHTSDATLIMSSSFNSRKASKVTLTNYCLCPK